VLEKKRGVILISKLCAILLMEADFNFANKTIFSRHMMHFAEDRNDIAGECASSRKHHKAIDVALNHRLFCDIARQYSAILHVRRNAQRLSWGQTWCNAMTGSPIRLRAWVPNVGESLSMQSCAS
jgi:hypothetical protein